MVRNQVLKCLIFKVHLNVFCKITRIKHNANQKNYDLMHLAYDKVIQVILMTHAFQSFILNGIQSFLSQIESSVAQENLFACYCFVFSKPEWY